MVNPLSGLRAVREIPGYGELSGFKKFLLRGNVVDLAVAVVIGTAFAAVVAQFGTSFLDPLVRMATGDGQFGGAFEFNGETFTYGAFLSQVVTFVITAAVVYFLVVVPVRRLLDRGAEAAEALPADPTELELLAEIRDLLRAQQGQRTAPAAIPEAP